MFYRGYDVFDQARVGFVSNVAGADGRRFTRYDTSVPGNGNMGHEYGTTLSGRRQGAHRGVPEDLLRAAEATMINDTTAGRWFSA